MTDMDVTGGRRVYLYHEDELRPGDIAVYAKDFDPRAKIVMVVHAGVHNPTLHAAIGADGKQILGLRRHDGRVVLCCGEGFYYVPYGSDRLEYGVRFVDERGYRRKDTATQLCEIMAEVLRE